MASAQDWKSRTENWPPPRMPGRTTTLLELWKGDYRTCSSNWIGLGWAWPSTWLHQPDPRFPPYGELFLATYAGSGSLDEKIGGDWSDARLEGPGLIRCDWLSAEPDAGEPALVQSNMHEFLRALDMAIAESRTPLDALRLWMNRMKTTT